MDISAPMIQSTLEMFLFLALELSALFLLISFGVGLLQQYIPEEKIQAVLSGQKGRGYFFAAILGAVTPFCSCSTIPMLRGLLKAKAGFGPTLTFLFTSPLLNPIIVGLFIVTFGVKVTVVYTGIALGVSVIAGVVLHRMNFERYVIPEKTETAKSCCASSARIIAAPSCCSSSAENTMISAGDELQPVPGQASSCCAGSIQSDTASDFSLRLKLALREAWKQFKSVFPYLLLGISLGSVVYGFVPSDFIAAHASGDSIFAVPVAAVIGIPLYIRAEALIPLSAALAAKGMGLGAVMALIIGGAGASLTEVILLKSMFRTPMIVAFLFVILGMAVLAGYLFQFVL